MLRDAFFLAKKDKWEWYAGDRLRRTWAETEEAEILDVAMALMEDQDNARARVHKNNELKPTPQKSVAEQLDIENWLKFKALDALHPHRKNRRISL